MWWKRWCRRMSDRSQELLDGEAVAASAEQAAKDQAQSLEPAPLTPLQPVVGYSAPPVQAPVLPVPPPPDFTYNAADWIQNLGTVSDTDNNTTAVFTIPTGKAPKPGNLVVCAVSCTNTTPGPTWIQSIADSRTGNTWWFGSKDGNTLTGPSAGIAAGHIHDLRDGDTITFTFTRATDKVAIVLAEFQGQPETVGGTPNAKGTSATPAVSVVSYAKDAGQNAYFIAVAYDGTQAITPGTASDPTNSEPLRFHGRSAAGSHSVELYSSAAARQSYSFTSTLPASADWAIRGYVLPYNFR